MSESTTPSPSAGDKSARGARGALAALRHRDHTQGSVLGSIAVLSLPAVAMSVLALGSFQMIDLAFLGRLGDGAIAAAGATNQVFRQFFFTLAGGVGVAGQMMIAQHIGRSQVDAAEHVAGQVSAMTLMLGALCALSLGVFPETFISLVANAEVVAEATAYARVVFLTFGVLMSVQAFNSILSGAGDATTPMIISFVQVPIAAFSQWVLAFGHFGFPALGIAGMALGFAVGGLSGLAISLWALTSGRCRVHLRAHHFRPDRSTIARLAKSSWQPALHMLGRSVMIWVFMWLAGRLGAKTQAAYTIGLRIELAVIMIGFPIANACATLVGQSLGARDTKRAWSAIRTTAAIEIAVMWPVALLVFLFRSSIVSLFTQDPDVAAMAGEYLAYVSIALLFNGLYFVAFRSLQAAGDMNTPMIIAISMALGLGAPLGIWLSSGELGATGMWIAGVAYSGANATLTISWLLTGRWARRYRASEAPQAAGA